MEVDSEDTYGQCRGSKQNHNHLPFPPHICTKSHRKCAHDSPQHGTITSLDLLGGPRLFAPAVCHLCKLMYWTKCFVSWRTNLTYMTSLIAKDYFS
jgi:hypothetical protein